MCCRYYYEDFERELRELLKAEETVKLPELLMPGLGRKDIHPSDPAVVLHGSRGKAGIKEDAISISEMAWGFSNPVGKGLIINARAETAREKKTFADSIAKRRCVIPASGFYEWDRYKSRFRFTSQDGDLILLAGFYREEQGTPRFTVLTTEANDSMIRVHDRMPVMLDRDEIRPWIEDDARLPEFLGRRQTELVCEMDTGQLRMDFGI